MIITERHGKMLTLMRAFPTLAELEEGDDGWGKWLATGWDPKAIDRWAARSPAVTSGSRLAIQFVLAVWSGRALHLHPSDDMAALPTQWECPWKVGGFDVMHALKLWDREHREAFLAFAHDPWWV